MSTADLPGKVLVALRAATVALLIGAAPAAADPGAPAGPSAADEVSGVLIPEAGADGVSPARALLLLPRLAVATAALPVRSGLTYYERHNLRERVLDIFFDDTRTFGIYPRLTLETRASLGAGIRLVHRDLFGTGARFKAAADAGGEYQQRLDASFGSPALLGAPVWLHLRGGWQRQPHAPFYGIGDPLPGVPLPGAPGIPAGHPAADATSFRQQVARAQLSLETDPAGPLFGNLDLSFVNRHFPGWPRGTDVMYLEAQVGLDTLRATSPYQPASAPATGTRLLVFGGPAWGVGGDATRYLRYGFEAWRHFDLYAGDRVLVLRAYAEGVIGRSERDVPFTDLPRLGGPLRLRGYTRDRFRDRLALLGTAEYRYPIWRELAGFLFVDAGRVLPGLRAFADFDHDPRVRPGAGGGLEMHQGNRFRMRGQVAGSSEGLFLQLTFEPAYRVTSPSYRI